MCDFFSSPSPQKFKSQLHSITGYQTTLCKGLGLWLRVWIQSVSAFHDCTFLPRMGDGPAQQSPWSSWVRVNTGCAGKQYRRGRQMTRSHTQTPTTSTLILTLAGVGLVVLRQNLQQTILNTKRKYLPKENAFNINMLVSGGFLWLSFQDTRHIQNRKGNLKTLYNNVPSPFLPKKIF